ncbi:MAG: hypothetical protein ACTS3F_05605 [Phycisphaerales bacterium]
MRLIPGRGGSGRAWYLGARKLRSDLILGIVCADQIDEEDAREFVQPFPDALVVIAGWCINDDGQSISLGISRLN